jgi:hypothetical protein
MKGTRRIVTRTSKIDCGDWEAAGGEGLIRSDSNTQSEDVTFQNRLLRSPLTASKFCFSIPTSPSTDCVRRQPISSTVVNNSSCER